MKNLIKQTKEIIKEKPEKEEKPEKRTKLSHMFVIALAIVSIIGFLGIIVESFWEFETSYYVEALLMFVVGIALIIEAKIKKLRSISKGLTPNNFTHLITAIIGLVAIIAGIFSFPGIRFENSAFLAIKGILSIIAIIVIVIQTWVVD